jgi:hypothetical protein
MVALDKKECAMGDRLEYMAPTSYLNRNLNNLQHDMF